MTVRQDPDQRAAGLVLAGVGPQEEVASRLRVAAARLASLTTWPVRPLDPDLSPPQVLAELGQGRCTRQAPAWLAPLPVDPGLVAGSGGSSTDLHEPRCSRSLVLLTPTPGPPSSLPLQTAASCP